MVRYILSQEATKLALSYGGQQFLDYIYNVFIPNQQSPNQRYLPLRTDFPDRDRNIVNTAWSKFLHSVNPHYSPSPTL